MDAKDILKSLEGPEIPKKPSVTVHVERGEGEDTCWLSQCVDPVFDMHILMEGLATAIVVAAAYAEKDEKEMLQGVIDGLKTSVSFHGKIQRRDQK